MEFTFNSEQKSQLWVPNLNYSRLGYFKTLKLSYIIIYMYLNTYDKYLSNDTNFTQISNITDKKKFQQLLVLRIQHNP